MANQVPLARRLSAAFQVMENLFFEFDVDGASLITFSQLCRRLSCRGFYDVAQLAELFARVDKDKSATLDFGEFLALLFLWTRVGTYDRIIKRRADAQLVSQTFAEMQSIYTKYDADHSLTLSRQELDRFLQVEMPELTRDPRLRDLMHHSFPAGLPTETINFTHFLLLIYKIILPEQLALRQAMPADTPLGVELRAAFIALEHDFAYFDEDRSRWIDLKELTVGTTSDRPASERADIASVMTFYFNKVDNDRSESLDFFEFIHLAFLLTKDAAYKDMVCKASDARRVKYALVKLRTFYKNYDKDQSGKLEWEEIQQFFLDGFREVPPQVLQIFHVLKIGPPERPYLNFLKFLQLLYEVLVPDGVFVGAVVPKPPQKVARAVIVTTLSMGAKPRLARQSDVSTQEIVTETKLGQGAQGVVYKALYRGHVVAAKYLLESANAEAAEGAHHEAKMLSLVDHPNCHFLIGSSLRPNDTVLVTEFCANGSIFDCYQKLRLHFDPATQIRLGREVAIGLGIIHSNSPSLMHRDIKSLNILLDEHFTAKIADFGLAKEVKVQPHESGAGTAMWMAPEVALTTTYDHRCDIFSYGVLLWEIVHQEVPYAKTGQNQAQIMFAMMARDERPEISSRCHPEMAALIRRCWDKSPEQRPSLVDVIATLDRISTAFIAHPPVVEDAHASKSPVYCPPQIASVANHPPTSSAIPARSGVASGISYQHFGSGIAAQPPIDDFRSGVPANFRTSVGGAGAAWNPATAHSDPYAGGGHYNKQQPYDAGHFMSLPAGFNGGGVAPLPASSFGLSPVVDPYTQAYNNVMHSQQYHHHPHQQQQHVQQHLQPDFYPPPSHAANYHLSQSSSSYPQYHSGGDVVHGGPNGPNFSFFSPKKSTSGQATTSVRVEV